MEKNKNKAKDQLKDKPKTKIKDQTKDESKSQLRDQLEAKCKECDTIKQQLKDLQDARAIDQSRYIELKAARAIDQSKYNELQADIEEYRGLVADYERQIRDLERKNLIRTWIIFVESLAGLLIIAMLHFLA